MTYRDAGYARLSHADPDEAGAIARQRTDITRVSESTGGHVHVWLTDNAATGRRNANPNWSPDGSSIVFTDRDSIDVSDAEIWTMRYLGTQRQRISNSPDFDFRPTSGIRRGDES